SVLPTGPAGGVAGTGAIQTPTGSLPTAPKAGTGALPTGTAGTGTGVTPTMPKPGDVQQPGATGPVPCAVAPVLAAKCQTCHAATPIGGAPMPLMTQADFHAPAKTMPTKKVFEVVQLRIHDTMRPMPPQGALPPAEMNPLDAWLKAGAPAGTAADATCSPGMVPGNPTSPNMDGGTGRLVPGPGEKCYEFKTHASTTSVDDNPYTIDVGEHYEQFYFKVPWEANSVATSYATVMDNAKVLHHWLLFSTNEVQAEGYHFTSPLPTLIGTDPILLAGWAVGGPNLVAPADVGFELPNPGRTINVQWHFYNSTTSPQKDKSSVQICVVPKAMRANVGGVTWLGTEDLNGNVWFGGQGMPPRKETTFTTTCVPGRRGMQANMPITIIGFEPHMHRIGKRMVTKVKKMDGTLETIFDKPFNFGNETHYYVEHKLMPGEQLVTSCTFNNDTDRGIPFGESSDTEMCYQFAFAYPAHALSNGAPSLLGVPDTCWGPNQ
ncbi:MAG TPA: hypothetical protein VJR89_22100, partial [Polyangiales bacterium]|nr:hypothetical protein [Polyangiales bacterium]